MTCDIAAARALTTNSCPALIACSFQSPSKNLGRANETERSGADQCVPSGRHRRAGVVLVNTVTYVFIATGCLLFPSSATVKRPFEGS